VDPVYAADRPWLAGHAVEEAIRGNVHTAAASESYVWSFFTDAADHRRKTPPYSKASSRWDSPVLVPAVAVPAATNGRRCSRPVFAG